MKTIQLKSLTLVNFKGIKSKTVEFAKETNIYGANGTGKTTLFDAFTWLLFGKNSRGETKFEIKTLDAQNNPIHKIDNEVSAVIEVDGEVIEIKRVFHEKWQTRRGATESEFGGNETRYFWNDVPMTLRDYSAKVSGLVEESVFKLITSPSAFNSLKWEQQRQVLLDICGGVTDEEVAKGNPAFENLLTKLSNKTLEEYLKQIKASIRKSKDEIKAIPTRIDEVERGKPEDRDWKKLEAELKRLTKEYDKIEAQISDKMEAQQEVLNKRQEIQKEIYSLQSEMQSMLHQGKLYAQEQIRKESSAADVLKSQLSEKKTQLQKAQRTLSQLESYVKDEQRDIDSLTQKNNDIRKKWNARNAEEFQMDEDSCKCPTCQRAFEAEDIEAKKKELFANFQNKKMRDLEELSANGKRNAERIEASKKEIETLGERVAKGTEVINSLESEVEALQNEITEEERKTDVKSEGELIADYLLNTTYDQLQERVEIHQKELEDVKAVDMEALKSKKADVTESISKLRQSLLAKGQIEAANKRIAALQEEEKELAQTIANYERDQHTIEQFTKAKINKLESLINNRFSFVQFKLFETQVNGGEVPTCKALINGVPFSDANTASRINAGVDIINTLCQYHKVSAPIFIDNRESVVELIPSQSQIINLIVSKADKTLRVEAPEMAELF